MPIDVNNFLIPCNIGIGSDVGDGGDPRGPVRPPYKDKGPKKGVTGPGPGDSPGSSSPLTPYLSDSLGWFSIRKLRNGASSIAAERTLGGTPLTIPWIGDALDVTNLPAALNVWTDQSMYGKNLWNSVISGAHQPTLTSTPSRFQFRGTSAANWDYFDTQNDPLVNTTKYCTVYARLKINSYAATAMLVETGSDSGAVAGFRFLVDSTAPAGPRLVITDGSGNLYGNNYAYTDTTTENVWAMVFDRTQVANADKLALYRGGSLVTPASTFNAGTVGTTNAFTTNPFSVAARRAGPAFGSNSDWHSVLFFNVAHSPSVVANISSYLASLGD